METLIFNHMETVRDITLQMIQRIPEEMSDVVPKGFNNNIRWNFGHIAYIQERLVFELLGEDPKTPKEFVQFFGGGTKPADWEGEPPTFSEIRTVLTEQKTRIRDFLAGRLHEQLLTPFTNKGGITFYTAGEALLFSFYHEALHVETIKRIYRFLKAGSPEASK
jgi:hypothetical protein